MAMKERWWFTNLRREPGKVRAGRNVTTESYHSGARCLKGLSKMPRKAAL